jgi:uncharacterized membrane protein YccC
MVAMFGEQSNARTRLTPSQLAAALTKAATAAGPPLFFGLRFWASICLALYVAFWLQLDNAYWAGITAAIVHQPQLGASLRKARFYVIGTLLGAVIAVVLAGLFPQDSVLFLTALALVGAGCALVAALLHNFASFGAALTGITVAVIAGNTLGATGGLNGEVFTLAVRRASEIGIGIACSSVILAVSDLGGARQRLSELFAALLADVTAGFTRTLTLAGADMSESQSTRRDLARRTIALDPVIDQAIGESFVLRARLPVLQAALNSLLTVLSSWRAVAERLARQSNEMRSNDLARQQARAILDDIAPELRSVLESGAASRWLADPVRLREIARATMRTLCAARTGTPSLRLLADQTARVLAGIVDTLNALALLTGADMRVGRQPRGVRPYVPDWLPAFVNAGRASVAIGVVELFWVVTAWPSGTSTILVVTIVVLFFAPRGEQAAAISTSYMVGVAVACVFAAIVKFAVLPGVETFAAFSIVIGLYLVPVGALISLQRLPATLTAMALGGGVFFLLLLAPENQMTYDTTQFYNSALAILAGCGAATLSFQLLPPLSPAFRTRRLLALTLRDLRGLATGPSRRTSDDWEGLIYSRLAVLPDGAQPSQRAQLVAALFTGNEIIRLRRIAPRLGLGADLAAAFAALTQGNSTAATAQLALMDRGLAALADQESLAPLALRARASLLALSDALTQYSSYFDAGTPA